jgi:broad specificity phosphatase PhoE
VLIIVRHGQTAANAARRLQGRLDEHLDSLGLQQAAAIADWIGTPDLLISSPLARAMETAAAFGCQITVDARWSEVDYGVMEGTPIDDVPMEIWNKWRFDVDFAPEGGESMRSVAERVTEAAKELVPLASTQNVVVVSHVAAIKEAVRWALGGGVEAFRLNLTQASITILDISPRGNTIMRSFNETGHLKGLLPPRTGHGLGATRTVHPG